MEFFLKKGFFFFLFPSTQIYITQRYLLYSFKSRIFDADESAERYEFESNDQRQTCV
jgi:hypothetical protein